MAVNVRENSEAKTRVLVGMATEPIVEVIDENGTKTTYVKMTPEKALRVVNDHIVNGNVVTEYTIGANQK